MSQIWVICLTGNSLMLIKQSDVHTHYRRNEAPMWSMQVNIDNYNNYNACIIKTVMK